MKTVQNKEEVFRTFEAYREEIYSFGVKRIGIFGSFVKRKQKKDSDVDVRDRICQNISLSISDTYRTR